MAVETRKKQARPKPKVPQLKRSQLEAVTGDDLALRSLNLSLKGYASEWIIDSVIDADVERTIEGASTFTITALDTDGVLQDSPYLGADVYTELDGLWFALVSVEKSGQQLTLTWEDREVYILRKYNKPKSAAWGATTRAKFIRDMVREVKEVKIEFVCPELEKVKPKGRDKDANDADSAKKREPGFAFSANIKVKGRPADWEQKSMIERVLQVGVKMKARRKVLVCAVMTITQESNARNLSGGDRDSAGLFQQRPSQGWGTYKQVTNPEYAATQFFSRAIVYDKQEIWLTYAQLCQKVQGSAFPEAYAAWRTEAEHTVNEFGVTGGDNETGGGNNQGVVVAPSGELFLGGAAGADYQFTRGQFSQTIGGKQTVKREDSWECSGRLADEVNWRRFMVSGAFYYVSEPYLFKSKPLMTIGNEYDDAIISIDYKYDVGKKNAEVTITAFADRWVAPPGSTVEITDMGVINGKWLLTDIRRPIWSPIATITLKKPRPKLPEPKQPQALGGDLSDIGLPPVKTAKNAMVASGYMAPLKTDGHLDRSEFMVPDAEGAPNQFGVRYHAGKDWFAPGGTPVVAPIDGTLVVIDQDTSSDSGQVFGGQVKLQQDNGRVWVFRHVRPAGAYRIGARVSQGTVIATVVRWRDNPSSSHCHIEVWKTLSGGYELENMLDPVRVLKGEA